MYSSYIYSYFLSETNIYYIWWLFLNWFVISLRDSWKSIVALIYFLVQRRKRPITAVRLVNAKMEILHCSFAIRACDRNGYASLKNTDALITWKLYTHCEIEFAAAPWESKHFWSIAPWGPCAAAIVPESPATLMARNTMKRAVLIVITASLTVACTESTIFYALAIASCFLYSCNLRCK